MLPEYIQINDKKYRINTSYKIAIKCNKIATDNSIGNYERALAVIYLLLGEEALNDSENHEKMLELIKKYMSCGEEIEDEISEVDMDFEEDMEYIKASFMSDYHIDLDDKDMHWWAFYRYIKGLSNSDMGNCCVLNRIRNIRIMDIEEIQDDKKREEVIKAKNRFALKKDKVYLSEEEEKNNKEFLKLAGIERGD